MSLMFLVQFAIVLRRISMIAQVSGLGLAILEVIYG